jgi:copper oxidase (laccase) domain-containing protein
MCRPDLFFSHRQATKLRGRTGRLMSVIGMRD